MKKVAKVSTLKESQRCLLSPPLLCVHLQGVTPAGINGLLLLLLTTSIRQAAGSNILQPLLFQLWRNVDLVPPLFLGLCCYPRNIWVRFKSSDSRLRWKTKHNLLRPACHTWTVNAWHCHWKPKRSWKVIDGDIKPWLKTRRMEAGATKEKKVGGLKHIAFYTCMESWAASAQLIAYCILIFSHLDLPPTWNFHLFLALHIKHSRIES